MRKFIVVMLFFVLMPAVAWAKEPTNAELYQMIQKLESKLDAAIEETNRAKAEASQAKEEAAKAKAELAQIKEGAPSALADVSLVRTADTKPGPGASFEVLYMRPSRSNLDFVVVDQNSNSTVEGRTKEINPDYDVGGRLGLSYNLGSGTDVVLQYTWLETKDSESVTRGAGGTLWGNWLNPNTSYINDYDAVSAAAEYEFDYYTMDLGIGQRLDIGKRFGLRIDAGLRYANMTQDFDVMYRDAADRVNIMQDNDFSGWGGRVGLGLDWRIGYGFNVFSAVAGSVLVGDFDLSYKDIANGTVVEGYLKESISNRLIPVLETRFGIGYAYQLQNGWSIGAKIGYEWQNWFNMVTAKRFVDDIGDNAMETDTTDVALDGFFFQGHINF